MKNVSVSPIILAVVAIVLAGGAFFGGMKYQQSKAQVFFQRDGGNRIMMGGPNGGNMPFGQRGQGGPGGQGGRIGQGFRPVTGQILSADDKSITVKLMDGSSKIVLFSDTTTINKAAEATKTDLKTGETVAVFGAQNPDGSVTAQNIQLNPIFRTGMNATPSASPAVQK